MNRSPLTCMNTEPTIATVPCFSAGPWKLEQLTPLHDHPLRTMLLLEAPAQKGENCEDQHPCRSDGHGRH
jgi:hypothetical protein